MKTKIAAFLTAAAVAFATPTFAQLKGPEAPAKAPGKIEVPSGIFYAGLGPTQYLTKSRLIGQRVVDKAGVTIGTVEDVILGTKDNAIDGLLIDASGKKLGVRFTEAKVETKDGKTTITLSRVTAEMVKVIPGFGTKK